jgi:prepilin-type N-terminal cleavage/methylation domain-containing protein
VKRPARSGFTLLEVLVAVALLGVVVSVLARSSIEGMSYEGDAARRTRASLLADRALFRVEAGLELGPPAALHEESEEGEFQINLDVQPIELGPGGLDALLGAPEEKPGAGERAGAGAKVPSVGLALFRVLVSVSWLEGLHEQSVTRSTFAYDASAAAQALGSEDEEKTPPPPAEEEP